MSTTQKDSFLSQFLSSQINMLESSENAPKTNAALFEQVYRALSRKYPDRYRKKYIRDIFNEIRKSGDEKKDLHTQPARPIRIRNGNGHANIVIADNNRVKNGNVSTYSSSSNSPPLARLPEKRFVPKRPTRLMDANSQDDRNGEESENVDDKYRDEEGSIPDVNFTHGSRATAAESTTPQALRIIKKKSRYTFSATACEGETPYKPKVSDTDLQILNGTVDIALSTTANRGVFPPDLQARFVEAQTAQRQNLALRSFPSVLKKLIELVRDDPPWEGFLLGIFSPEMEDISGIEREFWHVLRYGLVQAHEKLHPLAEAVEIHERTAWIDRVIPWISPLRTTGLVTWKWCEAKYTGRSLSGATINFADAVGFDRADKDEIVLAESSSGTDKENSVHTMEDSMKLIENTIYALRHEMQKRKDAAFTTMRQKRIYSIQHINSRITLAATSLSDDGRRWEVLELRSAILPNSWKNLGQVMRIAELLATLYLGLVNQREVRRAADNEINGLSETSVSEEDTVRSRLKWAFS